MERLTIFPRTLRRPAALRGALLVLFGIASLMVFAPHLHATEPLPLPLPPPSADGYDVESEAAPWQGGATYGAPVASPHADPGLTGVLTFDTSLMSEMLDFQNMQTRKEVALLNHRQATHGAGVTAIVGGQLRASAMAATTNTTDKFSYLGRFPTDFVGDSASDMRLLQGNVAGAVHFSPWVSGYFETLYSDVFTFPDFKQGSFQVRQAYVVLGNFDESPFYGYIGKKNVGFGDMRSLNPFSQAMTWHYFAALAEGGGVGYRDHGFDLTAAAINGGRGIRTTRTPHRGELSNFAANASYTWVSASGDLEWQVGAGYLHGTIYDVAVPDHLNPNASGPRNPAWDVNMNVRWGSWLFSGEWTETFDPWPATGVPVTAYRVEAAYLFSLLARPTKGSVGWSEGIQGPNGSEFEFNRQLVIGAEMVVSPNVRLSLEYIRSSGFAPLIDLTTVSDRQVVQNTALLGLTVVF